VARIESVLWREDAGQEGLLIALGFGRFGGFGRFLGAEDGPEFRSHGRRSGRLGSRDLAQVADVGELVIMGPDRPSAGHIHGNETIDAAFLQGVQRRWIATQTFSRRRSNLSQQV
jgi:hypothetical protein